MHIACLHAWPDPPQKRRVCRSWCNHFGATIGSSSRSPLISSTIVVVDKFSETRLVIEFWSDNFAYAIAFAGTMAFSVLLNLVLIGRFVMRHRSDNAFKLHALAHKEINSVSSVHAFTAQVRSDEGVHILSDTIAEPQCVVG